MCGTMGRWVQSCAGTEGVTVRRSQNRAELSEGLGALSVVVSPPLPWLILSPLDHANFCYLPSVCGNCKALFRRFFFNASSQQCEEFIYGGCGGNRNNFETKGECFQACSHVSN